MAVPDFQTLMLPVLQLAHDGSEHSVRQATDQLADHFQLTADERDELLPSGRQRRFSNRVAWAVGYLKQAGLLASPSRGHYRIAPAGLELLVAPPSRITIRFLSDRYPSFREFRSRAGKGGPKTDGAGADEGGGDETPEELMESAARTLQAALERDVLERVKDASPAFFEQLVLRLLVAMGYGGGLEERGEHLGRGGDEGVDGVIKEDMLGLERIYLQAKKYRDQPVGRPGIQGFAGSLEGQRAQKGVFITTSHFTRDAEEYVGRIAKRIVLIDGRNLARLMIEHGVGVTSLKNYNVLGIDESFFDEPLGS
jgi:restriction system protein